MTIDKIEALMTELSLPWEMVIPGMWTIRDEKHPQIVISREKSEKKNTYLLKFLVFICDVPVNAEPRFFKEFLKLNFLVAHGTFAMESMNEMSFMDTLEMENLDSNEFKATLDAMRQAPRLFEERYDIGSFTF